MRCLRKSLSSTCGPIGPGHAAQDDSCGCGKRYRHRRGPLEILPALILLILCSTAGACELDQGVARVVARLERADTLILDDGSEAVLSGILPPTPGLAVDSTVVSWPAGETTKHELEALVLGKTVELATAGRRVDRYGRQLVHAFVQPAAGACEPAAPGAADCSRPQVWVQQYLVERGLARTYALPGNTACLAELLAYEQRARSERRGHWATRVFQDHDVTDPRALIAYRDMFQTLEGHVDSVRRIRGQIVVSFAPGGRDSFEAVFPGAGDSDKASGSRGRVPNLARLQDLVGKRIRVRGWLELRHHPMVRLSDPVMVEVIEAGPAGPSGGGDTPVPPGPQPIPAVDGAR